MGKMIVLQTDFGLSDGSVATMKGVIRRIDPKVGIIDLTHSVSPYDVKEAAFLLLTSYWHFPPETIFVSVIDPGVGSDRRMIMARISEYWFITPDNGILWPILWEAGKDNIKELVFINPEMVREDALTYDCNGSNYFENEISNVFHGRDIFAPAAALVSLGKTVPGSPVNLDELVALQPYAEIKNGCLVGEVVYIDRFGNLITNITLTDAKPFLKKDGCSISVGTERVPLVFRTFSDARKGELFAHFGGDFQHPSNGAFMVIALREENASKKTGTKKGDQIKIFLRT